jgi:Flp pilus assembly protein TadG
VPGAGAVTSQELRRRPVSRLIAADEGAVAVIVALFAIAMFSFGALVVERGAAFEARRDAQSAADAAALAAAMAIYDGDNLPGAVNQAKRYARANYPANQPANYWAGCDAPLPAGPNWEFSAATHCVAFQKAPPPANRYVTVQVAVPGQDTPGLLGAVGGDVRAFAQARIPGPPQSGSPFNCSLCVVGTLDARNNHEVAILATARGKIGTVLDGSGLTPPGSWDEGSFLPPAAPPRPTGPVRGITTPCLPGVYLTISACTSFQPGEYVINRPGANTINPASNPTDVVFYFTGGATLSHSSATVLGRRSGTWQGYAIIFDPSVPAIIDLDTGPNSPLTVDGAFYAPSVTMTTSNGGPDVVVKGPLLLNHVQYGGGGSGKITISDAVSSRFPSIPDGTIGLVK